jgi:aspartyl aminopeptidase
LYIADDDALASEQNKKITRFMGDDSESFPLDSAEDRRKRSGKDEPMQTALEQELLAFLDAAPSPYHAVETARELLEAAGFVSLREDSSWQQQVRPGGRYYLIRNYSTIVAFRVGSNFCADSDEKGNVCIVGAHTDSPCLRVKPRSRADDTHYQKVAVECYGGGLWYTWFDRDLKCAGRVIWRHKLPTAKCSDTALQPPWRHSLVHLPRPILRVPSLAIHLDREVNQGFAPNRQTHLVPIIASAAVVASSSNTIPADEHHSSALMEALKQKLREERSPAKASRLSNESTLNEIVIHGYDLCLADNQPASLGGAQEEYIFASRLDNLFSCFAALKALTSLPTEATGENSLESAICMVALFDHEECGSASAQGAASPLVSDLVRRLVACLAVQVPNAAALEDLVQRTMRRSFLLSLDMAHAVHPNYAEKHESGHRPILGYGPVLKINANQRYATDGFGIHLIRAIAERCSPSVPLQEFVVRNDVPCGSTIGPIVAAGAGLRTVDIGAPSLSMHSIRETAHVRDLWYTKRILEAFFQFFSEEEAMIDRERFL